MTEEEAKTKWCPFARVGVRWMDSQAASLADLTAVAVNRGENAAEQARCLGSACMAWRWTSGWPLPDDPLLVSERYAGFCGLAGRP